MHDISGHEKTLKNFIIGIKNEPKINTQKRYRTGSGLSTTRIEIDNQYEYEMIVWTGDVWRAL